MKKLARLLSIILVTVIMAASLFACAPKTDSQDNQNQDVNINVTEDVKPGTVRGKILSDSGDMLVAGIIVVDEENNSYRTTTNAYGGYSLLLAPGNYQLTFTKGFEFSTYTTNISVESLKTYNLRDTRLTMLSDMYSAGWIAGDLHQHTYYSDGADSPESAMIANAASNIYWGFLTDHDNSRGVPEWREADVSVYTEADGTKRRFVGFAGSEATTEFGHFNSLGTGMTFDKYEIKFTDSERSSSTKKTIAREKMIYIAEQIQRQGFVAQMNHPYSLTNMGAMNYISTDDMELLTAFDTIEIWNAYFTVPDGRFTVKNTDNQNYASKVLWYGILNNVKNGGKFVPATSGTDNHDSSGYTSGEIRNAFVNTPTNANEYQQLCRYSGKYSGCVATYAYLGDKEINQDNVLAAITAGHSFLTNGPMLKCNVGGKIFGDTVTANEGSITFTNDIFCADGMQTIRFVKNGEIIKTITLDNLTSYQEDVTLNGLASGDWVLIEVLGDWGCYAISNPVFIG